MKPHFLLIAAVIWLVPGTGMTVWPPRVALVPGTSMTLSTRVGGSISDSLAQTADTTTLRVEGRVNATPWVTALGSTVVVAWGATLDGRTDVFLAMSNDGGRTFGRAQQINTIAGEARLGGEMPPRVELRARDGQPPEVIVLWTSRSSVTSIKLSRSTDGGRTFTPPVSLQASDAAGDRGWPAMTVDASGTAHVIWLDHRGVASGKNAAANTQHKTDVPHDGVAMAQRSALYYASAGANRAPERSLTPGVCYCCKTALASGPDGELVAAWRHVYEGNLRDIAFTISRDHGRRFAPPVRVSEDKWALNGCPDDGAAIAVDAHGTIHVVWPTVISGPEPRGALFYAASRDGRTFTPRVQVPTMGSAKPSHPHVAVDARGTLTIAWDEVLDGSRRAFVREAPRSGDEAITFGEAIALDDHDSAMYPIAAASGTTRVVVWTSGRPGSTTIKVRRF